MDSVFSHANWAAGIGGVSFPLLADFHPKGAVAQSYGLYNDEAGITFRATVLIDAGGTIRHIEKVTSARDMAALAGRCEALHASYEGEPKGLPAAPGFYHRPQRIDDLVDFVVQKILDRLGIDADLVDRWS